jgi:membrane protein implicated in regulation of membrane protease activity
MFQLSEFFKALPRLLLMVVLLAAGLVALFVAWWIALALILGFAIYIAVRRLLSPKSPGSGKRSAIIEGEFRVEREDAPPTHLRDRSGS